MSKPTKSVNGQEMPASCFLYVPDPQDPSTWKLPVKDAEGKPDVGRIAAAAAALSPNGFRGQKVDLPDDARAAVKKKLVALYKRIGRKPGEIPAHLMEQKALEDGPTVVATADLVDSIAGQVLGVSEGEYKGQRGLFVRGLMSTLSEDQFRDWPVLTPELKASTEDYFQSSGAAMIEHGRPYRGKSPVPYIVGRTVEFDFTDEGIEFLDFVPEPATNAPQELQRAYTEIKSGEFTGTSVCGNFYRDSGLHTPPGIIVDWELYEHSYCKNPVDSAAAITSITEIKAIVEQAEAKAARSNDENETPAEDASETNADEAAEGDETPAEAEDEAKEDEAEEEAEGPTGTENEVNIHIHFDSSNITLPAPEAKATPLTTTPDPAVDATPAPHTGGIMSENVNASGNNTAPENDALKTLLDRVNALEAEKKAIEAKEEAARRDAEARAEADKLAREIADKARAEEAERKSLIDRYTQEALSRYNIVPMGPKFTAPNLNFGGRSNGDVARNQDGSPRYTMAGPLREEKSLYDDNGNALPRRMVDWLLEVKSGQRAAQFMSAQSKYGAEAKAVSMGVPSAPAISPNGAAGGFALPIQYLQDIVPLLIDQFSIRSLAQVYPASSILLEVPKMATVATRATVTAEGDTKPKKQFGTDMISIRLYTVPQIIDVTNQLLNFSRDTAEQIVREQLADSIRLAEFYYALQGSGNGEPYGLIPALTANDATNPELFFMVHQGSGNTPTGQAVSATETLPDFIARAINVTQLRFYEPNALLVHPNIWWKLITTKDNYGRYLVDANMTGNVNSVWGIKVMHTTQLPQGKAVLGDWSKLRMYVGQDVTVDMTQEAGNRWDQNLTGFRIEEMIGLNAEQELRAFTGLDFVTSGVSAS